MKTKRIKQSERIAAYKVAHDLAPEVVCQIDGSIVNVKGHPQSYSWVLEFDTEVREVFKEYAHEYFDRSILVGGRRWVTMPT